MNKQTKLLTLLGILSIIMFPGMSNAQQKEGRAAVKAFSKTPKLTNATQRAIAAKNIKVEPWRSYRMMLIDLYGLAEKDAQALAAAAYGNMDAVTRVVNQGAVPKMAFAGAVLRENFNLAQKVVKKYRLDVNTPIFDNKTVLELLPDFQANKDARLVWLLDHGLNPDLIMTSGRYTSINNKDNDFFRYLIDKGLNPMAADKNNYTALHWYAEYIVPYGDIRNDEEFLAKWLAKFPNANPNVQDVDGNTPLHKLGNVGSCTSAQFHSIQGIDPFITNNRGEEPNIDGFWKQELKAFRKRITDLLIKYQYPGEKNLTPDQLTDIKTEAAHLSLYPQELVDYLIPLGATPKEILDATSSQRRDLREAKDLEKILLNIDKGATIPSHQKPSSSSSSDLYPPHVYEENPEIDVGGEGFDDD